MKGLLNVSNLPNALMALEELFNISLQDMWKIAKEFKLSMDYGLNTVTRKESDLSNYNSLKMLDSFIKRPTGKETGIYLAIDFGGTNIRIVPIKLNGQRSKNPIQPLEGYKAPLKVEGEYDYTAKAVSGPELFDFIVKGLCPLILPNKFYYLGHTFSFPCKQQSLNDATLLNWTKGFENKKTVDKNINRLLSEALERKGLKNVKPVVILNDTVATLLTEAYADPYTDMGSIIGTGHNTCYIDAKKGIINIESGNFNLLPFTKYDLDKTTENPEKQSLEKMVSGKYLGELIRLIIVDFAKRGFLFGDRDLTKFKFPLTPNCVSTENVSNLLDENDPMVPTKPIGPLGEGLCREEIDAVLSITRTVNNRAARLIASTFLGIVSHIDPNFENQHTIAVDGSVYCQMPGFAQSIQQAIDEALINKQCKVTLKQSMNGSVKGAAIAAAMAAPNC